MNRGHPLSSNMRGLSRYISELQSCSSLEEEHQCVRREMIHVRSKLISSGSKSDRYEQKKSAAKVIYTRLQGFPVDGISLEPYALMSSPKYSEKQMVR